MNRSSNSSSSRSSRRELHHANELGPESFADVGRDTRCHPGALQQLNQPAHTGRAAAAAEDLTDLNRAVADARAQPRMSASRSGQ